MKKKRKIKKRKKKRKERKSKRKRIYMCTKDVAHSGVSVGMRQKTPLPGKKPI
jgi:hypothetical protein